MNFSLLISYTPEVIHRTYNGYPIDHWNLASLPLWGRGEGKYDTIEFILREMLRKDRRHFEYPKCFPYHPHTTKFLSVQLDVTEGELPVFTFRTHDDRTVSVVLEGLYFYPVWNVSDLIEHLTHAQGVISSQFDYLDQMAVPDGHEVVRTIHINHL